jgi:hypothetical protein
MTPLSPTLPSTWNAEPLRDLPLTDARLSPMAVDKHWQALGQAWRGGGTEPGFNPGWARVQWSTAELHYDAVLLGSRPQNRAVTLNERTWELGDVFEIFLQVAGQSCYVEMHITPENKRLQLLWPLGGLQRVRQDQARLEEFTVNRPDWAQSSTYLGPGFWVARAVIPLTILGIAPGAPPPQLRTMVARYDYGTNASPVLSSTAQLQAPDFHRTNEWQNLVLIPDRS